MEVAFQRYCFQKLRPRSVQAVRCERFGSRLRVHADEWVGCRSDLDVRDQFFESAPQASLFKLLFLGGASCWAVRCRGRRRGVRKLDGPDRRW